jgi:hypothetical protein
VKAATIRKYKLDIERGTQQGGQGAVGGGVLGGMTARRT